MLKTDLGSEKTLSTLEAEEAKLRAALDNLGKEKAQARDAVVKEKTIHATQVADKLLGNIFRGEINQQFKEVCKLVNELYELDGAFESKMQAGRYGLPDSAELKFFIQFIMVAVKNNRQLSDIIAHAKKHGDNHFLKKMV